MNNYPRYSLISFIFAVSMSPAQNSYGVSAFERGLPAFPPVQRWLVAEQRFATIQMHDTLGTLFLCRGIQRDANQAFVLVVRRSNKTYRMSNLELNPQPDSTFRSTLDIRPFHDRETPFPLDVRVVGEQLHFRWVLSIEDSPPGGIAIAADVPIDRGKSFPNVHFSGLDGQSVSSTDFNGTITVLNSWATWCSACVLELPGFNKLVETYSMKVRFVAVAQNSVEELKKFLERNKFAFEHMIADDSFIQLFGGSSQDYNSRSEWYYCLRPIRWISEFLQAN